MKETGDYFDISLEEQVYDKMMGPMEEKRLESAWEEYWETVKEVNSRFVDSVERGKVKKLKKLLDDDHGFPIKIN